MGVFDMESKDVLGSLGAVAVAGVGWVWRQVSSKASKEDLAAALERFDEHRKESREQLEAHRSEAREANDKIFEKLETTNKAVTDLAVAVGRLQGTKRRS